MEDLLVEEDFKSTKKHNPWGSFSKFYIIAFIHAIVSYMAFLFAGTDSFITAILFLSYTAAPFVLPFIMLLRKKENILLQKRIVTLSIFLLTTLYSINFLLMCIGGFSLESNESSEDSFYVIIGFCSIFFIYFLITTPLIILILNYKRKGQIKSFIK